MGFVEIDIVIDDICDVVWVNSLCGVVIDICVDMVDILMDV